MDGGQVKLLWYFHVLRENGFEDMENALDLALNEMKEVGIDEMGHRKRIMHILHKSPRWMFKEPMCWMWIQLIESPETILSRICVLYIIREM